MLSEVAYLLPKNRYYLFNYLIDLFRFKMTNSIQDDVTICCEYTIGSYITLPPKCPSFKITFIN